jgi:hypothetical protein
LTEASLGGASAADANLTNEKTIATTINRLNMPEASRSRPVSQLAPVGNRLTKTEPAAVFRDSYSFGFLAPVFLATISHQAVNTRAHLTTLASALAFSLLPLATARAGAEGSVIQWQSPVTISGDTDVSTLGTLVAAFDMFGPTVVVNGVTFTAFNVTGGSTSASSGNFTFNESPGILTPSSSLGSNSTPFSNLSANYRSLLSSAISTSDNNTLTLTITGLTLGLTYQFQWWVNASTFNPNIGYDTTASAPNPVTLDSNTTDTTGGVGQSVIGTFFAGSTSEIITFAGTNISQAPTVNAFQLRVVPEPRSLGLFALGSLFLAALARQRSSRRR